MDGYVDVNGSELVNVYLQEMYGWMDGQMVRWYFPSLAKGLGLQLKKKKSHSKQGVWLRNIVY